MNLSQYYNVLYTLMERLNEISDIAAVAVVHEGEYIFKAYYVQEKLVFEIMNFATQKTVFHTTQAPNFYINITSFADTSVILMFMQHLNDRNMFNRHFPGN